MGRGGEGRGGCGVFGLWVRVWVGLDWVGVSLVFFLSFSFHL